MTIIDTNVISALMRDRPETEVEAWLDRQAESSIWTTSVTVFEVQVGLLVMPVGKKKQVLSERFENLLKEMDYRVAVFDEEAAREAAKLTAARHKVGRPVEFRDTMIAGIVLAHHATLATRNIAHFSDIDVAVVNPWAT